MFNEMGMSEKQQFPLWLWTVIVKVLGVINSFVGYNV